MSVIKIPENSLFCPRKFYAIAIFKTYFNIIILNNRENDTRKIYIEKGGCSKPRSFIFPQKNKYKIILFS